MVIHDAHGIARDEDEALRRFPWLYPLILAGVLSLPLSVIAMIGSAWKLLAWLWAGALGVAAGVAILTAIDRRAQAAPVALAASFASLPAAPARWLAWAKAAAWGAAIVGVIAAAIAGWAYMEGRTAGAEKQRAVTEIVAAERDAARVEARQNEIAREAEAGARRAVETVERRTRATRAVETETRERIRDVAAVSPGADAPLPVDLELSWRAGVERLRDDAAAARANLGLAGADPGADAVA